MYLRMWGRHSMKSTDFGISNTRQRLRTPRAFMAGVTARQMVPLPRQESATTRLVLNGSRPLSAHSTEA